jgi:proteasome accessory factor B
MRAQERLRRQWRLLDAISQARAGKSHAELMELTGISRATLHRDLRILVEAGLPLTTEQGRVRLLTPRELPARGFSALQIGALHLARLQLEPLAGAALVRELDSLLAELRPEKPQALFEFANLKPNASPDILKTLEQAKRYRRRAAIDYRSTSRAGAPARAHIEPLIVRVADGVPYLFAYSVEHDQERTYKLARIISATLTDQPATHQPAAATTNAFRHSVKAWSGPPCTIKVRLDPQVAWLAREYALPGQIESYSTDGSVLIEAQVAGLIEAQRRILAWGSAAEVLEPPELRRQLRAELAAALAKYDGPGPTKVRKEKSTSRSERGLKHGETRAG